MKSTGIIRRTDDLGRIVIPKEIRESFEIEEGTAIEIFTEENKVILKKYTPLICKCGQTVEESDKYCKSCGKEL